MLRKDVRIGLAIGGGLVAVLIVYLLITSGPPKNTEVTLVPDSNTPAPAPTSGQPSGDAATIDPFKNPATATDQPAKDSSGPATGPADDRWRRALSTGKVESDTPPLLLTETPAPAGRADRETSSAAPTTAPTTSVPLPDPTNPSPTTPSATPTGQRTHVIQTGESFSTIAQAVYGNSSYYPHLMRANPNIDPKKLRPGMTIVIPDPAQVVATVSPESKTSDSPVASNPTTPLDDKREYRVQSGDSLYKIALKLYGRADRADAIYDLNKDAIGPNRSYLKVGMTLKLPDPPTQAAAVR